MRFKIGLPAILRSGFGKLLVRGARRVPIPAAKTIASIDILFEY